jgi:hypothetical protein
MLSLDVLGWRAAVLAVLLQNSYGHVKWVVCSSKESTALDWVSRAFEGKLLHAHKLK